MSADRVAACRSAIHGASQRDGPNVPLEATECRDLSLSGPEYSSRQRAVGGVGNRRESGARLGFGGRLNPYRQLHGGKVNLDRDDQLRVERHPRETLGPCRPSPA
jgi:hypothetical protein